MEVFFTNLNLRKVMSELLLSYRLPRKILVKHLILERLTIRTFYLS
jgi:hypothetical protein